MLTANCGHVLQNGAAPILKIDANGKLPLDVAMLDLYETASISFFLLPTPKGSKRALEDKSDDTKLPKKEKKKKRDDRPDKGDKARVKVPEVLIKVFFQVSTKQRSAFVTTTICHMGAKTIRRNKTTWMHVLGGFINAYVATKSILLQTALRADDKASRQITYMSRVKAASRFVCVEIFCGKAKLSKFLRRKGFQVFSVDHRAPKGVPVIC